VGGSNGSLTVRIRIEDVRETIAAFRHLPDDANDELRDASEDLAKGLAEKVRAAGMALGPQDAIVARSVRARRDRVPTIQAGGGGKAGRLVYGSEFGMNKRSGWYGARRYRRSHGRGERGRDRPGVEPGGRRDREEVGPWLTRPGPCGSGSTGPRPV
jgi:hypothetical protein